MPSEEVKEVAHTLLSVNSMCQGHCKEMATVEFVNDGLMAAQVCPEGYVSRIILYGEQLEPEKLRGFVQEVTTGMGTVESSDVRVASRYAWDLGLDRQSDDLILKEGYWSQNYRRTKNESSDRLALFLCSNRDFFFVQPLNLKETLCENCRKKSP
jgi:(2Fe-2S) ferredoxin